MSDRSKQLVAFIGDVAGALGLPGAGMVGALVDKMFEARAEAAQEILLDEIRQGKRTVDEVDQGEAIVKVHRYIRIAQEGAAKRNLRMIARILACGTFEQPTPAAQFLSDADVLAGLRHEECVLLGIWAEVIAGYPRENAGKDQDGAMFATLMSRIPKNAAALFSDKITILATLGALTRTGLVVSQPGFDGGIFVLGPHFHRLMAMRIWDISEDEIVVE